MSVRRTLQRLAGIMCCAAQLFVMSACSPLIAVNGQLLHAAAMPLSVFPVIYVVPRDEVRAGAITDAIVAGLRLRSPSEVTRLTLEAFSARRDAMELAHVSVLLMIDASFEEGMRTEVGTRPDLVCGPLTCMHNARTYYQDIPTLRGEISLRAYDAESGQELQEVKFHESEERGDPAALRDEVTQLLVERSVTMMSESQEHVSVRLYRIESEIVTHALRLASENDWTGARDVIAILSNSPEFAALSDRDKARALFDEAQIARFAVHAEAEEKAALDRALLLLTEAHNLDGDNDVIVATSESVRAQRADVDARLAQREARLRNAQLRDSHIPTPPAAYRNSPPENPSGEPLQSPR